MLRCIFSLLDCRLRSFGKSCHTASNRNTRKVFSEYHNVPMDTHKVFTALVQWGSCRSPSVIHNREVLMRALLCFLFLFCVPSLPPLVLVYRPRGTDRVKPVMASRIVWVGVTSHYSHPLN
ncbi:unnamed protein product, partial [Prunus brigantina]